MMLLQKKDHNVKISTNRIFSLCSLLGEVGFYLWFLPRSNPLEPTLPTNSVSLFSSECYQMVVQDSSGAKQATVFT